MGFQSNPHDSQDFLGVCCDLPSSIEDKYLKTKLSAWFLLKDQFGSHNASFLEERNVSTHVLHDSDWLLMFSDGIWFSSGRFGSMQGAFWC
jgi:hypothetical protein